MASQPSDILKRLTKARTELLIKAPFYGHLLMRLKFALAHCGTAYTDMQRIAFDPEFVDKLSQEELVFVLQHEVMHCVLQHCTRAKGRVCELYNIAADIVVNSNILRTMGIHEMKVCGEKAMHLAPDGREGYLHTTEEVYDMLFQRYKNNPRNEEKFIKQLKAMYGENFDNHEVWSEIEEGEFLEKTWEKALKDTVVKAGSQWMVPPVARTFIEELDYESRTDWKAVLRDFIHFTKKEYDYSFSPADKRYASYDFVLPSFHEYDGEALENIWFPIDTSGSINGEELQMFYGEVKSCIQQFNGLSGKLSFFDTKIHGVYDFEKVEDLRKVKPEGGGGTSFLSIFKYMQEHMMDNLPSAIIIFTDGYAFYPDESMALGIPVLWAITGSHVDAPWGKTIHID